MRGRRGTAAMSGAVLLLALAAGCASGGDKAAGAVADTVALAISDPRQSSGEDYARAALDTRAARDGRLAVIGVEEGRPATLTFRVRIPESGEGFTYRAAVTACYDVRLGGSGLEGGPDERSCPEGATEIVPTPKSVPVIPAGSDDALRSVLDALPATVSAATVEDRVASALRAPGVSDETGAANLAPGVAARVVGGSVGVAVRASGDVCMFGVRSGGTVQVWRPSRVQVQPGELTCAPETALALQGGEPPH